MFIVTGVCNFVMCILGKVLSWGVTCMTGVVMRNS